MLTIEEFIKLPDEEKAEAFKKLSDHDRFVWRTQYEPINFKVIGSFERTDEERKRDKERFRAHLKKIGVLEED
ncbi:MULTISPECIES: hypothetical protein [unclassified Clostridioides]|uniref:hypothetical protein n=1 Tax=unclassified Clostridioides TaxID=2635829 RepID=UPI001D0F9AC0|nr:hypothetical protein [Clostridioides sp. ES-S-0005-03]UDN63758.1 hypothetical protein IC758_09985 [Clostridioides sp. ES-W-0016-02]